MKIYINGRFLSQRITGVQRYAREMVNALDKMLQQNDYKDEWCILAPKGVDVNLSLKKVKVKLCGITTGHIWEQIELPIYARNGYLVNLCNCAPLIKKRQLVTIHDAAVKAFPKAYSWKFRTWYKFIYTICGKRAERIVTVSNFSRDELNKYFRIDKERIKVIYNGIEHLQQINEDKSIIDDLKLIDKKYVLGVSSKSPSKNFKLILKAAKLLNDVQFIIVGGKNNNIFTNETDEILSNVAYTGYITDEKLVALYRHAGVFVYPSLYEGFGIPPLEAMSQGCQVIVSDCASLPEVCGSYAKYCGPEDERKLCREIVESLNDKSKIDYSIDYLKGKYSWNKSAKMLVDCIKGLCN